MVRVSGVTFWIPLILGVPDRCREIGGAELHDDAQIYPLIRANPGRSCY